MRVALIPRVYLDAVVAIGFPSTDGPTNYCATRFLYGHFSEKLPDEKKRYRTFLVTNKHVFDGQSSAVLRFNPEAAGSAREYPFRLVNDAGDPVWVSLRIDRSI